MGGRKHDTEENIKVSDSGLNHNVRPESRFRITDLLNGKDEQVNREFYTNDGPAQPGTTHSSDIAAQKGFECCLLISCRATTGTSTNPGS